MEKRKQEQDPASDLFYISKNIWENVKKVLDKGKKEE